MSIREILRSRKRVLGRLAALAIALAILLTPMVSAAETPVVRLVLYEVSEGLKFKPAGATDPTDFKRRMAAASLLGTDVTPLVAGTPFVAGQFIKADASSNVSLTTGVGPVSGVIQILTDLDPTRNSLDTLLVTVTIPIQAELDLTTATQAFAGIQGKWQAKHQGDLQGQFAGFFLIPFQIAALGTQYWYVDLGPGSCAQPSPVPGLCPLTNNEFALGIPLTKAVITLSTR